MRKRSEIISTNVQRLMNENGLNQTDFGKRTGLDPSWISKIVGGILENPRLETLASIAMPFGKSVQWLLTDHDQPDSADWPSEASLSPVAGELVRIIASLDQPELEWVATLLRGVLKHRGSSQVPSHGSKKPG